MTLLILPPKYQPKVFMPVPDLQWREPSQSMPRDQIGNLCVQTRFVIKARLEDDPQRVIFKLIFDSRDDADAFFFDLICACEIGTPLPRESWRLPQETYGDPELWPGLLYELATVTFLSATGANTWTVPYDYNSAVNAIETLGAGGSGAAGAPGGSNGEGFGAGGGAYSKNTNLPLLGGASINYTVGVGGPAKVASGSTDLNGVDGGDTFFNATTLAGSSVGAKGGSKGSLLASGAGNGGLGGQSSSGIGNGNKFSGGNGGNNVLPTSNASTGGGGSAGPNGAGNNGANTAAGANNDRTAGGSGDAGFGGSAGAVASPTGGSGGNGTEWDGTHGSGGGGASQSPNIIANPVAGSGGNYGGGGAGMIFSTNSSTSGAGIQGLIVVTYTSSSNGKFLPFFR